MAGEMEHDPGHEPGHDPGRLRISDAERHQVAELLRDAAGEGRLDLDELEERLEATYAARTYADLVPLTMDLPTQPPFGSDRTPARPASSSPAPSGSRPLVTPGPERESHVAIMGGLSRKGDWVVPRDFSLFAMMGGAELDLRRATFAAPEVVLTLNVFMGGAEVVVPPGVRVQMEGTGIMGGYSGPSGLVEAELGPDAPVVRIRGVAIWGGVSVERKHL